MLQVPQLWLLGEPVLELGWLAVLVGGRELHGCDLLCRVLIQDQPFVGSDGRGEFVL